MIWARQLAFRGLSCLARSSTEVPPLRLLDSNDVIAPQSVIQARNPYRWAAAVGPHHGALLQPITLLQATAAVSKSLLQSLVVIQMNYCSRSRESLSRPTVNIPCTLATRQILCRCCCSLRHAAYREEREAASTARLGARLARCFWTLQVS